MYREYIGFSGISSTIMEHGRAHQMEMQVAHEMDIGFIWCL